jgi:hypothetical protein
MSKRLFNLLFTVLMILSLTVNSRGEEGSALTSGKENEELKPSEAPAPPPGLLMSTLGKAGLAQPLDKARVNIYGYVEGGYFYDLSASGARRGKDTVAKAERTVANRGAIPWSLY